MGKHKKVALWAIVIAASLQSNAQPVLSGQALLLRTADSLRQEGNYTEARAVYEEVLSLSSPSSSPYLYAAAATWLSELSIYDMAYPQAMSEATLACETFHRFLKPDTSAVYSTTLMNLGICEGRRGNYNAQLHYYQEGQQVAVATGGLYSSFAADAYCNVAVAYGRRGFWETCRSYADTALIIAKRAGLPRTEAIAHMHLSQAFAETGDLEQAVIQLEEAIGLLEDEALMAQCYNNLGSFYIDLDEPTVALMYLGKALEIRKRLAGGLDYYVFRTTLNIIRAQMDAEQSEEAVASLDQLISDLEAIVGEGSAALQIAYNYRAKQCLQSGDFACARKAIEKAAAVGAAPIDVNASTQMVRAEIALEGNDLDEALAAIQVAFRFLVEGYEPADDYANPAWPNLESVPYGITLWGLKGRALRTAYRQSGALAYGQQALLALQQADSLIQDNRLDMQGQSAREAFAVEARDIYEELVKTLYALYQGTGEQRYAALALRYMEKSRSLSILENLNELYARSFHDIPDSVVEEERNLRAEIRFYEAQADLADAEEVREEVLSQLNRLIRQHKAVLNRIAEDYPRYYKARLSIEEAGLKDLQQKVLYEGEAMVSYFATADTLLAVALTRGQVAMRAIPANDWGLQAKALAEALRSRSPEVYELSHRLYHQFFAPLEPLLAGHEKVIIIPDGALFQVPFDQLVYDLEGGRPAFLLERFSFRQLLSGSAALQQQAAQSKHNGLILALAPEFDGAEKQLPPLPGAQAELDSLSGWYKGIFLRRAAAREAEWYRRSSQAAALHLATHTEINPRSPSVSKLVLNAGGGEDGALHAYELYAWPLVADLAFLSGCNTGVGEVQAGEGNISLSHAFAYAGCSNIIMTLWPLGDVAAPHLVAAFYRNINRGLDKAEALREAKMEVIREEPLLAHPYYWSGFVYQGNREPITISGKRPTWPLLGLFAAAAAILASIGLYARFRKAG